ncbi:tetratricopeptide repeat protein [Oxalobacteraceae bacterium]|nr:tetratricopeptide repeat protein [Oxalobacteraceae bacterium]
MSDFHANMVAALLQQAVGLHQQGQLQSAQALYRRVLDIEPHQFDALHLCGVIARQQGQVEEAIELIGRALSIDATQAAPHCNLGAALQDAGRAQEALESYERALQCNPGYALAYSNRGNALRKLGRPEGALDSYEHALHLKPDSPETWCQRSIVLLELERADDALASAGRALTLRPAYADAHFAQGNALQALHRFDEALPAYQRALDNSAGNAQLWCARGTALQRLRRTAEALYSYEQAVAIAPGYALAHQYRGNALRALQRPDEAIAAYKQALYNGGAAESLRYALASLGVGEQPAVAPAEYVRNLFDQYAGHFDQHLLDVLDYQVPALLDGAIARHKLADNMDTLDLGCGTGLCGPYLRGCSRTLTGVDLSDKMLDKARERGLYDQLVCAELTVFLAGRRSEADLIVAADVFVYIGDLAPVFGAVSQTLRAGGLFCFTAEADDSGAECGFALRPSNRYAHAMHYLRTLAAENGLTVLEARQQEVRKDHGESVNAYLMVMCKI